MRRAKQNKQSKQKTNQFNRQENTLRTRADVYRKVNNFTPLNTKQEQYLDLLKYNQIIVATGEPGTGKSLCPIVHALSLMGNNSIDTIYLTKPIIEVGGSLGYLPGGIEGKFSPYMTSMVDHMYDLIGKQETTTLLLNKRIQCLPLQFMRGINLDNCVIVADEMQNSSLIQTKTLLTRLKENTQLVMTGDLGQCDLDEESSLPYIMRILSSVEGVGSIHFEVEDIVRSGIVKDIMVAFKEYENLPTK